MAVLPLESEVFLEFIHTVMAPSCRMMSVHMPDGSHARLPGLPICFDDEAPCPRMQPPQAGEHTDAILTALGSAPERIASLRDSNSIR